MLRMRSEAGTTHYHPQPSPEGSHVAFGTKRKGVRQIVVMRLADRVETQVTHMTAGHAALWPHWQPGGAKRRD